MKRIDGLCLMCKEKEATALHHLISDRVYLAMLRYELGVTTTLEEMHERFKFIGSIKKDEETCWFVRSATAL